MTDKQIIIDGVDVKDCKRRIGKDNFCRYYKRPCAENNYNCIWKKYLRKEQECEKLKKYLHQNFKEKDKLHLIIDILLKASGYDTNTASAEDFEDVYENMRYEKQQLEQLGQTLTEIKEVAKNGCYDDCGMPLDELSIILQKISEVEDES